MLKIRKIYIKNFRSIKELRIDVTNFSIFVGDNDCGKSNVFHALNLFFNGETSLGRAFSFEDDFNKFAPVIAKKAKEIIVELILEMPENYHENSGQYLKWRKVWRNNGLIDSTDYYGMDDTPWERKPGSRLVQKKERPNKLSRSHSLLREINFEYIPAIRSPLYLQKLRGRIYDAIANVAEKDFRRKSSAFEESIGNILKPLTEILSQKLLDDTTLRLPNDLSDLFESLDFLSGDKSISLNNRGDGIKGRYIPFLLKFITDKSREFNKRRTFIWAYEEPENNMEFNRARELSNDLFLLAKDDDIQLLITTHSPVFYNLHNEHRGFCTTSHLIKENTTDGTVKIKHIDENFSLDEHMGAMYFIAPYIADMINNLDEMQAEKDRILEKISQQNSNNLPVLFVEGQSDYELLKGLAERFFIENYEKVFFATPPIRAGADYVANSLIAWELNHKNCKRSERVQAFGLVDNDKAGKDAMVKYKSMINKSLCSKVYELNIPKHLDNMFNKGILIPVTLEELISPEYWLGDKAQKTFLQIRPKDEIKYTEDLQRKMFDGKFKSSNLLKEEKVYLDNKALSDGKIKNIERLLDFDNNKLKVMCAAHILELERVFHTILKEK